MWLIVAAGTGCCDRFFYYPSGELYSSPSDYRLAFEPVTFHSQDGTRLSGWFLPAEGEAKGTVIHCHGNAQNMTTHWLFVEFLPRRGYNLFVFDYRGYGTSEGSPSRRGTVDDAQAAVEHVLARDDVDPERVALFGQSLGGAIAVVVAAEDPRVRAVVVESAFTRYRDEAVHVLRRNPLTYLPARPLAWLLVRRGLDPAAHIARVSPRPVLIIHGTGDRLVPSEMSRELAALAGEPKELWLVDEARHLAVGTSHPTEYERKVCGFLEGAFRTR